VAGSEYKPKGIDIRVARTKKKKKPTEEPCDWEGCVAMGGCKAPKGPDRLREYYNFCTTHAREYRPTWDVRKNTGERASAQKKRKAGSTAATAEGYNIFGEGKITDQADSPRRRSFSAMQLKALNDLGLDDTASKAQVSKRYKQLVKQLHPDANQGDRTTEESFQRVVKAHKILRSTGLA